MERITHRTRMVTTMGMLLAIAMVLSFLEHQLPPLPPPLPPGLRFGISNVIVMYTLFFLGWKAGYTMAILKSLFVLLQRGPEASFMSIVGGLLSLTAIHLISLLFQKKVSYLVLSICGAVAHNVGQMVAASIQFGVNMVAFYWPILVITGILLGAVTGTLLNIVMPVFHRISGLSSEAESSKKP